MIYNDKKKALYKALNAYEHKICPNSSIGRALGF